MSKRSIVCMIINVSCVGLGVLSTLIYQNVASSRITRVDEKTTQAQDKTGVEKASTQIQYPPRVDRHTKGDKLKTSGSNGYFFSAPNSNNSAYHFEVYVQSVHIMQNDVFGGYIELQVVNFPETEGWEQRDFRPFLFSMRLESGKDIELYSADWNGDTDERWARMYLKEVQAAELAKEKVISFSTRFDGTWFELETGQLNHSWGDYGGVGEVFKPLLYR